MLDDLKAFARYAAGLGTFLKQPLTPAECRRAIERQLHAREESFLRILERAVFRRPQSPYYKLLMFAGIGFEALAKAVRHDGVEATLAILHEKGVYVTLDQFKGRQPIERPGLNLPVDARDFDNPLLTGHFQAATGGSRGVGRRILVDFDLLSHEAAYYSVFFRAFAVDGRPNALWFPPPPAVAGIKQALRWAKLGVPPVRWFAQSKLEFRRETARPFIFARYALSRSRLSRRPLPAPEYVPPENAAVVAEWLAAQKRRGTPAVLAATPSSSVRVCVAARELGLDISETFFQVASEPYTPGKARMIADAGCVASSHYAMAEIGSIGMGCSAPSALDEVHLMSDKVAVLQRDRVVGAGGMKVGALLYTTILPSCPKLMLNVESDDYGVVGERDCGCPFGRLGFRQHLHTIRSYDKLTSEGMTFLGSELISLLEEILPARFGGHPTDYQFAEEETDGLPKINVVVSPRVGAVDERQIVDTILERLRSYKGAQQMMADFWGRADALRVVRREPYATGAAKILPLHILRATPAGRGCEPHG